MSLIPYCRTRPAVLAALLTLWAAAPLCAQDPTARSKALDEALQNLQQAQQPSTVPAGAPQAPASSTPQIKLIDVSLDGLFALGGSTVSDADLPTLNGGGHDPRKRGVTVQNVELSLVGAVDPYFKVETHLIYFLDPETGESEFELEEAFAVSTALPAGLQLKAGQFFTEFGRINPRHPHQWDWENAPVINTRLFGPDGMRGPGVRLSWLTPLPWYSDLLASIQNANGETMSSFFANEEFFGERPVGGRPFVDSSVKSLGDLAYLLRNENSFDLSETTSAAVGVSATFGPNATGDDGNTLIYGADLVAKWRPLDNFRGWPFVIWQTEVMTRKYDASSAFIENDPTITGDDVVLPRETLHDSGLYSQLLWGFSHGWAAGLRYDYADGTGPTYDPTGAPIADDPFRDTRHRVSPLLMWQPSEFSRVRLQYDYDHADWLEGDEAHSVWLGFEFLIGSHPAHKY